MSGRRKFGNEHCTGCNGCNGCQEEGIRKEEEGKLTGSLALAGNRDPEALPRLQKNRRQSKSEMRSQAVPGNDENEEKTTFYKICLLPKLIIHQRQKRP